MERERLTSPIAVELRAADGDRSPRLRGVALSEGFPASGGRREVFVPGSIHWSDDGVGIRTDHASDSIECRTIPVRQGSEIKIDTPANDALRRAYEKGSRFLSIEFRAEAEELRSSVRTILRATVDSVALTASPEYVEAIAEVRSSTSRSLEFWI